MVGIARGVTAVVAAVLLVLGVAAAGHAAVPADEQPVAGPADVSIPYEDTASIEPQPPWRIVDCAAVRAASELVRSCDGELIVLGADGYDPDAGVTALPVTLTTGTRTMTVAYRVTREAPPAPATRAPSERFVAAGALLRVPLTDFALACTVCGDGGSARVWAVDPVEAGTAWTTATHVVFHASRHYRGKADIHVAIADDFGTVSATGVPAFVYPGDERVALTALDVRVPLDEDGGAEIDLTGLTMLRGDGEVLVVGCGASAHGAVACDATGRAVYRGSGRADQFSFRVAAGGEQAWGSVTLVETGEDAGLVPTAPPAGDEPVPMAIIPPLPPEGGGAGASGLFPPFTALLDRVGAK